MWTSHLANAIMAVVTVHEASWSETKKAYGMSLPVAIGLVASQANLDPDETKLIDLLLSACWNDAQDWAREVLR